MRFLQPEPFPTIKHLPPFGQGVYVAIIVALDALRVRLLSRS
jgi:hypothetical protein